MNPTIPASFNESSKVSKPEAEESINLQMKANTPRLHHWFQN